MSIKVSVVIPCYNHGRFLNQTLQSVLQYGNQSILEIIIVNDGSNDLVTIEILNSLNYSNVYVINKENQGLAKARNTGVNSAKGEYILTLDSDNYIDPKLIHKAIKVLDEDKSVGIVYSDRVIFKDGTNDSFVQKVVDVNLKHILFGETVDACAVFRKSVWVALGGYDEKMPIMGLEDWDFWIRALEMNFKFYHINTPLFFYRDVPHSMIKVMKKNQEFLLQYIVKKHAHLYARYILEVGKEQSYERRKPVRNLFRRLTGLRLAN